ncbi:MAG: triose-phosphate isomerase [Proteobacteria bacterium]|nr:triose-phosphate isomerase [Candidatus Fonsibacter ubiquis]NDB47846.1 triose-phosphate isomerase [Pseudomonadota bacterium]NDD06234.1 triose-phosphate isomerase [Pseudomonadota bacterium]
MAKTIYFIGNWKMNGNYDSIKEIERVNNFLKKKSISKLKKIIFCPPSNLLMSFSKKINTKLLDYGAQDISRINLNNGPYTGQLSAKMIKESGANYVIVGHSEKRLLDEDYKTIKKKISIAIENKLKVIFCIGENLFQKKKNLSFKILKKQILNSIDKKINFDNLIIAYEPIWSIGTGIVPSNNYLDQIYTKLKKFLREKYKVNSPILIYGGSVTPDNVVTLGENSLISGFLIGGASLKSKSFIEIIKNYFR